MFTSTQARAVFVVLVAVALIGCGPALDWLRDSCQVVDPVSGQKRAPTAEEIEAAAQPLASGAKAILVQTGNPQWAVLVDLGVKVAALALAYLIRPRETTVAAALNGGTPAPAAPRPAAPA